MKRARLISKVEKILILTSFLLALASTFYGQNTVSADDIHLTDMGRKAYTELTVENQFSLGGTGISGETSSGEKNFDILLQELQSEMIFYRLATANSGAGGLYGLFGLKLLKSDKYSDAYIKFVKLPDQPTREYKLLGKYVGKIAGGAVERMDGCMLSWRARADVAKEVNEGKFDFWIEVKLKSIAQKAEYDKKVLEQLSNTRKN